MNKFPIKKLVQESNNDCGPTCLAMITRKPISEVKKELNFDKDGIYMVQLVSYLRYLGYSVVYHYFNPQFLRLSDENNCSSDQLIEKLLSLEKLTEGNDKCFNYMMHYLHCRKEKIHIYMMTKKMVKTIIDMGGLCLSLMTSNYLYFEEHKELNYHYNIIVGYEKDDFIVYDPLCKDKLYVDGEKYLHGVYSITNDEYLEAGSIAAIYDLL